MGPNLAYVQISEDLRSRIDKGEFKPGSLLPTEAELQDYYRVSRTTIRNALGLLSKSGLLASKRGYGTQVNDFSSKMLLNGGHRITRIRENLLPENSDPADSAISYVHVDKTTASCKVCDFLSIPVSEEVFRIQSLSINQGQPLAFITNYMRTDLVPGLEKYSDEFQNDLDTFLQDRYQITMTKANDSITACSATLVDSRMLGVSVGAPLITLTRKAYSSKGPLEYRISKIRADRFSLEIDMKG